jgi:hypothetical protein
MTEPIGTSRHGRRGRRPRAGATRRFPSVLVVVLAVGAVVAAGLAVDGRTGATEPDAARSAADLAAVAPAEDALGSTWYCAAGTAAADGGADHRVTIANLGTAPVDVVLTVVPGAAVGQAPTVEPAVDQLAVDPGTRTTVVLAELVAAPYVGAIVEAGRGEVVVEHVVSGGNDPDAAPCASSSSSTWYVAAGTTTRDAREELMLFNPFPDDAVVDVTFTTPDGLRAPPGFAGLIVPGQRVTVVDVGAVVSRHPNVSTSVVARSGRLVVERLQRFDGSDGPAGMAVTPAAPSAAEVWHLPDGLVAEGISEVVTVYNPTDRPAEVDVEVDLDPSTDPSAAVAAAPYSPTIAAHGFTQIDVGDTEDGRVPAGRGHSITVRSQNGVPVVAERWVRSASPAARTGFEATLGSPVVATRWLSAVGSAVANSVAESLVLANPAAEGIARVRVAASTPSQLLPIAGLEDVEVPAQGRVVIDLGSYINREDLLLVVTSSLPIVAERALYSVAGGRLSSILVPSAPTATVAAVDPSATP